MKLLNKIALIFSMSVGVSGVFAQADNPCDAPTLLVGNGSTCKITNGTTVGATSTTSVVNPDCGSYTGSDVWYKVVVPASGILSVELKENSATNAIADAAMAWYSGNACGGSLTQIACDDDSGEGLMPKITDTHLTPGETIYVRIWKNGEGQGVFSLCATSPNIPKDPCIGGQNFSCANAQPFCTNDPTVSYCNSSGGQNPNMGTYGCLFSTPNAMWLYMQVATSGPISVTIHQTNNNGNGIDVDYAVYGPFTDLASGCPVINGSTPTVSCSYSASATETATIPNAQAGQFYVMLVTNYNGQQGSIQFTNNPTAGSGTTNCNIFCTVTSSSTGDICNSAVGTVTANPTNGEAPFSFLWSNGATTQTVNGLTAGTYTVTMTDNAGCQITSTTTVTNSSPTFSATSTPATCITATNGTAKANFSGASVGLTATYLWNDPAGQTTQVATGLAPGAYTCTITLSNGCTGTATVNVGFGTINGSATSTIVSCPGGTDGTATATSTAAGPFTYLWNDPLGQTTQTATGLAAGTYNCVITTASGCTKTVTTTITEIPGMVANFNTITDVSCHSKNNGVLEVTTTQGTAPYTYSWDHSSSTTNVANDLFVGAHTVTITDAKGCVITKTQALTEPDPLKVSFITPNSQICPENTLLLTAAGIGGSTPYTFTWKENGQVIGQGTSITVDPEHTNTTYCVELTEVCGSPMADSCMVITFPTPIPPMLTPDKFKDCRPGEFTLSNTSPNVGEVATTFIDFGNYTNATVLNGDTVSVIYDKVGTYTLTVVNTSIYGCVYDTVLVNFLEVTPEPTAKFYVAGNPSTVYETALQVHDLSSPDVKQWEWVSPYSIPTYSSDQNPKLVFPEGVEGVYPVTLIVTSGQGCTDTLTLNVIIEDDILFYAPNTFTPDGDEFNQSWRLFVKGGDFQGFNLKIYNRWGEVIWETNDPNIAWDGTYNGKTVQQGTYAWRATLKNKNNDGKNEYSGYINLIR